MNFFIPTHPHLEIRLLQVSDFPKLQVFCNTCKEFGWANNSDFNSIKLQTMVMPYGAFFIGFDHLQNKIWSLAGVHQLPEIGENAWRCLFRGAQLPGYLLSNRFSKNVMHTGMHISLFLWLQIEYISSLYNNAEFYLTTNNLSNKTHFASSQRLDSRIMPLVAKTGVIEKVYDNFMLYSTSQTVWRINVDNYYNERKLALDLLGFPS
jgi:hypothetical protein